MTDSFWRWGAFIYRIRWIVLAIWLVILGVCGGVFAPQAGSVLKAGGIQAPGTDSDKAAIVLQEEFGTSTLNNLLIVFHHDEQTIESPDYRQSVEAAVARVQAVEGVNGPIATFYNTGNTQLLSQDRKTTVAIVPLEGDEGETQERVPDVRDAVGAISLGHYVTGLPAINYDFAHTSEVDLKRAEMFTIPLVLFLLILTFRTVISAAVPLILGAAAVVTALAMLYVAGSSTDVSIFALNVASMIGLGLGIDFSLIVVNRFREELALRGNPADAVAMTMATAGRSIVYSGITVILGMIVLTAMFNLMVVRSISLGVMLVAVTALLAGMTLLPALLGVLGHRLEWLRVLPKPKPDAGGETGIWYRLSHAIMRRPVAWLTGALVILFIIAYPARELDMIGSDPGLLPDDSESVQGVRFLDQEFGQNLLTPIQVVIRADGENAVFTPEFLTALDTLSQNLLFDARVEQVQSLSTYVALQPRFDGRFQALKNEDFVDLPPLDPLDPNPEVPGIGITPFIDVWAEVVPHSPAYFGFAQMTFGAGENHALAVTPALQVYRVNSGTLTVQADQPLTLWRAANFGNREAAEVIPANTPVSLVAGDQVVVQVQTAVTLSTPDGEVDMLTAIVAHVRPGAGVQETWTDGNPTSDPFAGLPRRVIGGGLGSTFPTGLANIKLDLSETAPGARFPRHTHPGPELIVTESGVLTIHSSPEMVMTGADGRVAEGPYDAPIELGPTGKAVVQGSGIHRAENLGTEPAQVWSLRVLDATEPPFAPQEVRQFASQFVNLNDGGTTAVVNIFTRFGPYTDEHEALVSDIREVMVPQIAGFENAEVLVGGNAANFIDFRDTLYGRFPFLVLAVLALTFIILMMFFQSIFLPFKAILMNLASILATYGALVLIFQHGWGSGQLGFEPLGGVAVVTPAILFVILFSLSTDYEVFMLSRVKEYYHATGNNEEAVAAGAQHTSGVITAAGLILIGTFGSFATAGIITIKEIGLGLAIGVLIDTTIVRVILVPATMRLAGSANWFMPPLLKRFVPELSEGPSGGVPMPAGAGAGAGHAGYAGHVGQAASSAPSYTYNPPPQPAQGQGQGQHQGQGYGAAEAVADPYPAGPAGAGSGAGGYDEMARQQQIPVTPGGERMAGQLRPTGGPIGADVIVLPRSRAFRIGRDATSDLQVFDPRISRNHAEINRRGNDYIVSDLNSTNGVYINGRRITEPAMLRDGDAVEIGNTGGVTFTFELRSVSGV